MQPRGRVLIVDDNKLNVDVLCHLLSKEYDVDTAFSGADCLARLPSFAPQVVLLDIMMPGMDGYEACRRIKEGAMGESVHVILISGKGMVADRVHGYESQADDYVVKPFDHKELLSKVRVHFRQFKSHAGTERTDAREAMNRLLGLIDQMSSDIAEHTRVIDEVQRELDTIDDPDPIVIGQAMICLADTNRATQLRLASAERNLRDQALNIESHATEARTDALTSLPNRRAFDEELRRRVAEVDQPQDRLWAVMVDVDNFKSLNDQWGHQAGDEALRGVARLLARVASPMHIVARYGGDEFAALMSGRDIADVAPVVERLREAAERAAFPLADQTLSVTVSIGCAAALPDDDGAALVHRADEAMYAAKQSGKNRVWWHDGIVPHPVARQGEPSRQRQLAAPAADEASGTAIRQSRVLKNYL